MECVSFKYHKGQYVYFMHNDHPYKNYIEEININIKDMYKDDEYPGYILRPIITYKIKGVWFKENELYDDKDLFKKVNNLNNNGRSNINTD